VKETCRHELVPVVQTSSLGGWTILAAEIVDSHAICDVGGKVGAGKKVFAAAGRWCRMEHMFRLCQLPTAARRGKVFCLCLL
jgi:hypothetical protein